MDNHLVELAVAGGADAFVTNNVRDIRRGLGHGLVADAQLPSWGYA